MRRKPDTKELEEAFIKKSPVDDEGEVVSSPENKVVHSYGKWPLESLSGTPIFEEGSKLRKPINLQTTEFEWNTIDLHTKKLGIGKNEWIRHAVYKLLLSEQAYLLKNK